MKLYIVRHGRTDLNDNGIMQGSSNIALNESGIKQAYIVKEKLSHVKFDICISSPLKRTVETAKIIIDGKCNIIYDDLLFERNLGLLEGKPHEIYKKYEYWNYVKNESINSVEPIKELFKRTKIFIDKVKKEYKNKIVLIVSHSATIRAIHYNIVGYDENTDFLKFNVETGSVYEYEI